MGEAAPRILPLIKSIAVIGGGPSGIATAKSFAARRCFDKIDVYEQASGPGGAWRYTPLNNDYDSQELLFSQAERVRMRGEQPCSKSKNEDGTVAVEYLTPMYDHLETNIPKGIMGYKAHPFSPESSLFPTRQIVCTYLDKDCESSDGFRVFFDTQVILISPPKRRSEDLDADKEFGSSSSQWCVHVHDTRGNTTRKDSYDAIAVCNGHYTVPHVPELPGLTEWRESHPGSISHSKYYRNPSPYAGQKTLVVGYSASGLDIASQILRVCATPLLVSSRTSDPAPAPNIQHLPEIAELIPSSRSVRFANGQVEPHVDHILFCTGYLYSFPFLQTLSQPITSPSGFQLLDVYEHMFWMPDPTLAFVAIPYKVIPMPLSEAQSAVIGGIWSGEIQLPSQEEMGLWQKRRVEERGDGKYFHVMKAGEDFEYQNWLWDWAEEGNGEDERKAERWTFQDSWLRARFPALKKAYTEKGEERWKIKGPEELGFKPPSDASTSD
ncbi:hypothetical protein MMC25_004036 [Agyrium rufum]|nr:hypothetical protein [Agyrium rufum]